MPYLLVPSPAVLLCDVGHLDKVTDKAYGRYTKTAMRLSPLIYTVNSFKVRMHHNQNKTKRIAGNKYRRLR